jgi:hypothetical protein
MSRGLGNIETRIADLFAASHDRALSMGEIADYAFELGGRPASRAQRLSATRPAYRVIKRVQENYERARQLVDEAHAMATAALRLDPGDRALLSREYWAAIGALPIWRERKKLEGWCTRIGVWVRVFVVRGEWREWMQTEADYWCATVIGRGRGAVLWFHPPDVPVRVWAVTIARAASIGSTPRSCGSPSTM